jgi:hypothetical protein
MIFSTFLGSLDFCFFVSRQRSLETTNKINEEAAFKHSGLEISDFYNVPRVCCLGTDTLQLAAELSITT